jgi:anti-anti-sigma factor
MNSPVQYKKRAVHVDGEMTVYTCGQLKPLLLEQLTKHANARDLDLSRVIEMDTAGLQLLLTARRHANRDLRVTNPSRAVTDVLELCRLGELLKAAEAGAQ